MSLDGLNAADLDSQGASARLRWDFGQYKLHSITGYESVETLQPRRHRRRLRRGVPRPASGPGVIPFASETADAIPEHSQWTQEFRIESDSGTAFDWQAGLFLFQEDYDVESFSYDSLNGNAQDGYQRINQTNDSWAVFGAAQWQVSAGVRAARAACATPSTRRN